MRTKFLRCGARRALQFTLFSSLLAMGLTGCSKPTPVDEPIRAVKVMTVGTHALQAQQEYAGEIRPRVESRLGFRVGGKLMTRAVELGQHVQAGQTLAQLDPQDYRLTIEAAQAQMTAALTNRDLAAADLQRYQELREKNFISSAELDRRAAALKAAQAQLEQAQSQLSVQRHQGDYATLKADVAGVVTAVEAEPGQVVSAGTPVVRLAQDGPRDAVMAVPEDKVKRIHLGDPVRVRLWPEATEISGKVREVAASADPVTRTYLVKVGLSGADVPALGATVTVVLGGLQASPVSAAASTKSAAIKLPTSALRQEGNATAVWLLDAQTMTVRSQTVQIATADGNEAVVASGLTPGMEVVIAGVHVLSPGQKVRRYEEKQTAVMTSPVQSGAGAAVVTPAASPAAGK